LGDRGTIEWQRSMREPQRDDVTSDPQNGRGAHAAMTDD
jgi:hypothetical protein